MSQRKKQYNEIRKEYKKELYQMVLANQTLVPMIIETYAAWKHKRHIMRIWAFLGKNHKGVYKEYCNQLMGGHLTGSHDILRMIGYDYQNFYKKWHGKIPIKFALGDALAIAYRVDQERRKK